jgi:hypothetical protein
VQVNLPDVVVIVVVSNPYCLHGFLP